MAKLNGGYIGSDQRFSQAGMAKTKKHRIERSLGNRGSFSRIQDIGQVDLWINENSWENGADNIDSVTTMLDQSGRGNHATRIQSGRGRLFRANARNGLPGLEFTNQSNQRYQTIKNSLNAGAGNFDFDVTIVVVAKHDDTRGLINFGDNYSGPNSFRRNGIEWEAFGIRGEFWDTSEFSTGNWEINTFTRSSASARLIEGMDLGTGYTEDFQRVSSMRLYINGKALTKTKNSVANNASKAFTWVGANTWGIAQGRNTNFDGILGEVIIYNKALNSKELAFVHETLSEKWAIPLA